MKSRFGQKYAILIFCLTLLCAPPILRAETGAAQKSAPPQSSLSARQIRRIVDRINLIEELPIKKGEAVNDKYAKAIVELGKDAAPYLVEKLTNRKDSRVAYLYQYKIGDVALALLNTIYDYPDYPFPDQSRTLPAKYGDYRDYTEYFSSARNRRQLQKSWRNFIKNQSGN